MGHVAGGKDQAPRVLAKRFKNARTVRTSPRARASCSACPHGCSLPRRVCQRGSFARRSVRPTTKVQPPRTSTRIKPQAHGCTSTIMSTWCARSRRDYRQQCDRRQPVNVAGLPVVCGRGNLQAVLMTIPGGPVPRLTPLHPEVQSVRKSAPIQPDFIPSTVTVHLVRQRLERYPVVISWTPSHNPAKRAQRKYSC